MMSVAALSLNRRTPRTAVVRPRRSETILFPLCTGMMSQSYGDFVVSDIGVTPQAVLRSMLLTRDKATQLSDTPQARGQK